MPSLTSPSLRRRGRILSAAILLFICQAFASTEKVLYNFTGVPDGDDPYAGLIFDSAGNLYGTTHFGGLNKDGSVFKLAPAAGGKWTETVIFSFNLTNGSEPYGELIMDAAGNLYGTAQFGGTNGHGVAFKLTPGTGGKWTQSVIHNFGSGSDGSSPLGALVFDTAGNLYGTTNSGSTNSLGAVYELIPGSGGKWTEKTIHVFSNNGLDGTNPAAGLVFDSAGNLYGTTKLGGANNAGVVFKLTKGSNGQWSESLLHVFNPGNGKDGAAPIGKLLVDSAGNIYGTTSSGGAGVFYGTVFELTPGTNGKYSETIIHGFGDAADGGQPQSSLAIDTAGSLYGTAYTGGTAGGVLFKFTLQTTGKWKETVLHNFGLQGDGKNPITSLIWDAAGNLYGTTQNGGTGTFGTVFEVTP